MEQFQTLMEKARVTTSIQSRALIYQEIYELIEDIIYTAIRNERGRR